MIDNVPKEDSFRRSSDLGELVGLSKQLCSDKKADQHRPVPRASKLHFHAVTASMRDDSIPLALWIIIINISSAV